MRSGMGSFEDVPLSDFELRADDQLFTAGPDWQHHAMPASRSTLAMPYVVGFHTAGNALVARAIEQRQQEFLVFPVLYCYRHAIELGLKDIIYLGQREKGGRMEVIRTHKLDELWRRASAVIESAFEESDPAHEHVGRLIEELAAVDPEAEMFRYDRDRRGSSRTIPDALIRVDLAHIKTIIGKVMAYIDACDTAISEMLAAMPDY